MKEWRSGVTAFALLCRGGGDPGGVLEGGYIRARASSWVWEQSWFLAEGEGGARWALENWGLLPGPGHRSWGQALPSAFFTLLPQAVGAKLSQA